MSLCGWVNSTFHTSINKDHASMYLAPVIQMTDSVEFCLRCQVDHDLFLLCLEKVTNSYSKELGKQVPHTWTSFIGTKYYLFSLLKAGWLWTLFYAQIKKYCRDWRYDLRFCCPYFTINTFYHLGTIYLPKSCIILLLKYIFSF